MPRALADGRSKAFLSLPAALSFIALAVYLFLPASGGQGLAEIAFTGSRHIDLLQGEANSIASVQHGRSTSA